MLHDSIRDEPMNPKVILHEPIRDEPMSTKVVGPRGDATTTGSSGPQVPGSSSDPHMQFMCLMLQSMQEMQKQMANKDQSHDKDCINGEEVIRAGITELPLLPEWDAAEAPLKLGDWLTLISPMVADLTSTAEDWWDLLLKEVGEWYQSHLAMSPLDRTSHSPTTPLSLQEKRWRRLERRVAGLLLKAVPEGQREDLVAKKHMSVFGILTSLQISYQPGGFGEKRTLLRSRPRPPMPPMPWWPFESGLGGGSEQKRSMPQSLIQRS